MWFLARMDQNVIKQQDLFIQFQSLLPLLSDDRGVQTASLLGHKRNPIKCQPINGASRNIKTVSGLV